MKIYWIAHCITNPALWKLFSFFAGVRSTITPEKIAKNKNWHKKKKINWDKDFKWGILKKQIALAKKHKQKLVVSVMPEVWIKPALFKRFCEELLKRFGKEDIIWDLGTEPTIVADYSYEDYWQYYRIAQRIFENYETTAPGYTLISDKEVGKYSNFIFRCRTIFNIKEPTHYSIHLYGDTEHRKEMTKLAFLRSDRNLWITETGWSSESKWWHWFMGTNGEKEQLKDAKKDLQMYKDMGIEVVILYNWKDDPNAKNKFCKHAGLLRADGTEKPLFTCLKEKYGKERN